VLLTIWSSPWFRVPLVLLAAIALQTTVVAPVRIFGASADIVVLVAIVGGLVGGSQVGSVIGFTAGLLYDLTLDTPFGLWALTLACTGYVVGFARRESLRDNFSLQASIVALASAAAIVFYAVVGTIFGAQGYVTFRLLAIVAMVTAVNVALYRPTRRIMRWALQVEEGVKG
jgi:rod shape-determining protein MreD